jgi:hypothetical protein
MNLDANAEYIKMIYEDDSPMDKIKREENENIDILFN